jgi:uncharacterized protein DUF1572
MRMSYLADVMRQLRQYKALADAAIARTPDAFLHTELDPRSNSVAIIVKHVAGNLRSRYRDFLTTDGEKPDRHRDREFEMPDLVSRDEMVRSWDDAWSVALGSIGGLGPEDLERTVHIRGEAFLVVEALNRTMAHTAYHVGQIVYLARHFAGPAWEPLTIPKGASARATGDFKTRRF